MSKVVSFNSVVDAFEEKEAEFNRKLQALYDLVERQKNYGKQEGVSVDGFSRPWLLRVVKELHAAIEELKK